MSDIHITGSNLQSFNPPALSGKAGGDSTAQQVESAPMSTGDSISLQTGGNKPSSQSDRAKLSVDSLPEPAGEIKSGADERASSAEAAGERNGKKTASGNSGEGNVTLTFIHTNDAHGYVEEHAPEGEERVTGGLSRTAAKIREIREENRDGAILVDGGDVFDGGFYSKQSQGEVMSRPYRDLEYDAITIGNHDLSWGLKTFEKLSDQVDTDFLAANMKMADENVTMKHLKPYKVIERKGVRIGVIGATSRLTAVGCPDKKALQIVEAAPVVKSCVEELKSKEKVDMIVLLSHLGYDDDVKLAQETDGIDIIIGSHSHKAIPGGEKVGNTIIVQTAGEGNSLGRLDVDFDITKNAITSTREQLIPVTENITPDPAVEKILAPFMEKFKPLREEKLAVTDVKLDMFDEKVESTNLTNLFIDAMKMDSDIALGSMFSIRKGIAKGTITTGDLFNTYPFENRLCQVKTTGASVLRFLETALKDGYKGNYILASGLSFEYKPSLPEGQRITSITFNRKKYTPDKFAARPMTVSMDEYIQGKSYFRDSKVVKEYGLVFEILKDYLKTNSPLGEVSSEKRYTKLPDES
ncbi:MAG: bifunctional UDP-sugar hydrolase/5'-nucleotidase [Vulcanimicrobiota bacterium]